MPGASTARAAAPDAPVAAQPAARKPHVCFVSPYLWPVLSRDPSVRIVGGAEVQQSILARLFVRHGYRVSVVCCDYGQPEGAEIDGIRVYKSYRQEAGLPVLRFLHPRLTGIWRALRAADADIYYERAAGMLTGVMAQFCRRHGRRSIFAGAADNDFDPGREQIRYARDRWMYQRGVRKVDAIVAQNPHQVAACRAHYGREAVLIPSCYELPESARPGSGDLVLWVATIHQYKRPDMVVEIARRLPHRRFVMIGGPSTRGTRYDPSYHDAVRDAAAKLPNVSFKGFLPLAEVETWFDRARVFLNTSLYEGVPNTFMQAWARGVPTVATVDIGARAGGKPVYEHVTSVEESVAGIERLFQDELHWTRASARCREYFERSHSPREALARYERLFAELSAEPSDTTAAADGK